MAGHPAPIGLLVLLLTLTASGQAPITFVAPAPGVEATRSLGDEHIKTPLVHDGANSQSTFDPITTDRPPTAGSDTSDAADPLRPISNSMRSGGIRWTTSEASSPAPAPGEDGTCGAVCPDTADVHVETDAAPKTSIFFDMAEEDFNAMYGFIHQAVDGTWSPIYDEWPATPAVNYVAHVEAMPPNKEEALAYLDGDGPVPERWARVIYVRGAIDSPDVMEYRVGPLPLVVGQEVTIEALTEDGQIGFIKRPSDVVEGYMIGAPINAAAWALRSVLRDLTGGYCTGTNPGAKLPGGGDSCDSGAVDFSYYPLVNSQGRRQHRVVFFGAPGPERHNSEESYLHPIPLSFTLDNTDPDQTPATIEAFNLEYCNQGPFASIKELLEAFESKKVERCSVAEFLRDDWDYSWANTTVTANAPRDDPDPKSQRAPPRSYMPEGHRFSLVGPATDRGSQIKWMGWEAFVTIGKITGLKLFDIKLDGKRIVYELALQEQFVSYSGYNGVGQTVYLDSYLSLGAATSPLKRGIDCPTYAHYVDAYIGGDMYYAGSVKPDAWCIFEEDMSTSAWRHTHGSGPNGPHADGMAASELVIRWISTLGNYDYIFDIRFKSDGSMTVNVSMAGYMETSPVVNVTDVGPNRPFGTRVHKYSFANLHDHLSSWKLDMDIAGRANSVMTSTVKAGTWQEAFASTEPPVDAPSPGWFEEQVLKYVDTRFEETEFGTTDQASVHRFVAEGDTAQWEGGPRGYAIVFNQGGHNPAQVLPDDHPVTLGSAWSKYNLAVTRRKEDEQRSHSSEYDMNVPQLPVRSLDDQLDGEAIRGEDLVAWLNVGVLHIPRTEDVPLVQNMMTGFSIKPWNYFGKLRSMTDVGPPLEETVGQECLARDDDPSYEWSL